MSAIILAGGQSRRLGQDKAWVKVDGQVIIQRILARIKPLFKEIIVVGSESGKFQELGVRTVSDELPDKGPLGGLYSGLRASSSKWIFCCACDMPFLNQNLIVALANQVDQTNTVLCKWEGKIQPLHGFYNKNCLPVITDKLQKGQNRVCDIFPLLKVKYLGKEFIVDYDPNGYSFFNLNTPEALKQAKNIAYSCTLT